MSRYLQQYATMIKGRWKFVGKLRLEMHHCCVNIIAVWCVGLCSPSFLYYSLVQSTTLPGMTTVLTVTLSSNIALGESSKQEYLLAVWIGADLESLWPDVTSRPVLIIEFPSNLFVESSTVIYHVSEENLLLTDLNGAGIDPHSSDYGIPV